MGDLENRVCLVTGAARGLGLASATRMAEAGASVMIADVLDDVGEAAAAALRDAGHRAVFHPCDVGDKGAVDALVAACVREYGRLDGVFNNAGINHGASFLDFTEEDFDRVIRVNLKGTFLVGQAAARQMVAQAGDGRAAGRGGGAIVNMSSVNAVMAIPEIAAYNASKGGVNQITKTMALALAPHNIRVNAIGPGSIDSDMLRSVNADPAAMARVMSRTPLGRIGRPEEIGDLATYLVSDRSSYITGQVIYIDGGRLAMNYTC